MQSVVICSDAAVLKTNLLNMFLLYVLLPRISSESDFMLEKHKDFCYFNSLVFCVLILQIFNTLHIHTTCRHGHRAYAELQQNVFIESRK